jgi:trehalose 6-phosphate synthase/phosphatase
MAEVFSKRLIIVSNRLPFQLLEKGNKITLKQSDGGLVTALKSYFEEQGVDEEGFEHKIWLGSADFPEKRWERYNPSSTDSFRIEPIFIDQKIYNKYYNGFCNATLWPLFHYFPSYVVYEREYFESYEAVNEQFADQIRRIYQPGDVIWIHDYQLFLVPHLVRESIPNATIGFFLHIPFPSYEIFRLLHRPWKEKIIRGLLGADLIGFHTHEYVQHFLKSVRMVIGLDHHYRVIAHDGRLVKTEMFPLGIDFDSFNKTSLRQEVVKKKDEVVGNFPGKKILFSVDRLDYTKGVTHRLAGFERFLLLHPEWLEKVVFILVVVPSRQIISKYNERRKLIEEQVGSINGKYSTLSWQPIIYRYSHLPFEELCALYLAADVGLITPLRDGMNLVAKEYVASCSEKKGVLILSELAGAASELGEAILVNPLDEFDVAGAIEQSLSMPLDEQQRKLETMQQRLKSYNVLSWVHDFFQHLSEIKAQQNQEGNKFLSPEKTVDLVDEFHQSEKRLLLLDYDGTLVGFARLPQEAKPPAELISLITRLAEDERNDVAIISGRDGATLQSWFGDLNITLVAEHGAAIRRKEDSWELRQEYDQLWKPLIRPTLEMFSKRCPGSFIEEKNHTLAWHYRNVEAELGFTRSRELLDNLFHLVRNVQLQVIDGNKVIEVRIAGIDKGAAALKLLQDQAFDFVLAIGDDKTDEDMFRALAERGKTIKVGAGHSVAQYCIRTQREVLHFLNELVTHQQPSLSRK